MVEVATYIHAGGLGSRLKPLTNNVPKPALPISFRDGRIRRMIDLPLDATRGVSDLQVVSTYYLADNLERYLPEEVEVARDDQPKSGIQSMSRLIEKVKGSVVYLPCDSEITSPVIEEMLEKHTNFGSAITMLATKSTKGHNRLFADKRGRITAGSPGRDSDELGDLGIMIYNAEFLFSFGASIKELDSWSVLEKALNLGELVLTHVPDNDMHRVDLGTPASYYSYVMRNNAHDAHGNVVFPDARVEKGKILQNSILLPNSISRISARRIVIGQGIDALKISDVMEVRDHEET